MYVFLCITANFAFTLCVQDIKTLEFDQETFIIKAEGGKTDTPPHALHTGTTTCTLKEHCLLHYVLHVSSFLSAINGLNMLLFVLHIRILFFCVSSVILITVMGRLMKRHPQVCVTVFSCCCCCCVCVR